MEYANLSIGQKGSLSLVIDGNVVQLFGDLVSDHNPVHFSDSSAQELGFERRIAHGMILGGLIGAVLASKCPGPGSIYLSQTMKFLRPVFIGDLIIVVVTISELVAEKRDVILSTDAYNQKNVQVLSGSARVRIPVLNER